MPGLYRISSESRVECTADRHNGKALRNLLQWKVGVQLADPFNFVITIQSLNLLLTVRLVSPSMPPSAPLEENGNNGILLNSGQIYVGVMGFPYFY